MADSFPGLVKVGDASRHRSQSGQCEGKANIQFEASVYVILRGTSHPLQLSNFVSMQHDAAGIGDILQHFLHYAWMHWAKWYVRGLRVGGAWSRKVEMQICITTIRFRFMSRLWVASSQVSIFMSLNFHSSTSRSPFPFCPSSGSCDIQTYWQMVCMDNACPGAQQGHSWMHGCIICVGI